MEIISYVHQEPGTRFSLPGFNFSKGRINRRAENRKITERDFGQRRTGRSKTFKPFKKIRNSYDSTVVFHDFTPGINEFSIPKVKSGFSLKVFLMNLGHGLTVTGDFISSNIKKIMLWMLIAAGTGAIGVAGAFVYNHLENYSGPLKMQQSDCMDEQALDKFMQAFALETEADEEALTDSAVDVSAYKYTQPVSYQTYKVQSGDTISGIAKKFGLSNISTLISVNDIGNVRQLAAGQKLKIPSIDGIVYSVKSGDTLEKITKDYNVKMNTLLDVNELTTETLTKGQILFLPGAALDSKTLKTAMGDRFILPIAAKFRWTSPYGKRIDPIAGVSSFHTGTDMACPTGTPILAAMSGTVVTVGVNRIYGNYIIIDHGNGYQTLYAHMSKTIATKGQWVSQGTRIGLVGSTGYSTGPHLHFTVYKNGKMIDPMTILK